jgi:hypothetical protein
MSKFRQSTGALDVEESEVCAIWPVKVSKKHQAAMETEKTVYPELLERALEPNLSEKRPKLQLLLLLHARRTNFQ